MTKWKHGENPYGKSIGAVFDLGMNQRLHGRIVLDREDLMYASTTKIFDNKPFDIPQGSSVHGVSEKGKVSLLSCYGGSFGHLASPDGVQQEPVWSGASSSCDLRSEYALFGNEYLRRNDPVIGGIRFSFEDFHSLLDNLLSRDSFGCIIDPDPRILEAIEKHKPHGAPGGLREYDKPWILYFNGRYEVLPTTQTVLGSISVLRTLHVTMSGGANASDAPYVNISFDDQRVTLDGAIESMHDVRQFFSWMSGYAPKWMDVRVLAGKRPPARGHHLVTDEGQAVEELDVFTSYFGGTTGGVHQAGKMLISPVRQPSHFMEVMKNWLERNSERTRPNRMFFASTRGMFTTVLDDRMCAAANVFEQLPVGDRPNKQTKMLDAALRRYQKVIRPRLRLPRMEQVIRSAISCRQHITHGRSTAKKTPDVDFADLRAVDFLTEALRFVYGVSELLDCGWDMEHWLQRPLKRGHPFGCFLETYEEALSAVMPEG